MVIEQIVEAIQNREEQGVPRRLLAVFCSPHAAKIIADGICDRAIAGIVDPPPYRVVEKYIGREMLTEWWVGDIMGVPVLRDPDCPIDYWRVESMPEFFERKPPKLGGVSVSIVGGTREDYERMFAQQDKQRAIEQINAEMESAINDLRKQIASRHELWSDVPMYGPTQWQGPSISTEGERTWCEFVAEEIACTAIDGLPVAQCFHRLELRARPGYESRTDPIIPEPFTSLTFRQEEAARTEWSRRLRELQAEARRKEREQVVIDIDWE